MRDFFVTKLYGLILCIKKEKRLPLLFNKSFRYIRPTKHSGIRQMSQVH